MVQTATANTLPASARHAADRERSEYRKALLDLKQNGDAAQEGKQRIAAILNASESEGRLLSQEERNAIDASLKILQGAESRGRMVPLESQFAPDGPELAEDRGITKNPNAGRVLGQDIAGNEIRGFGKGDGSVAEYIASRGLATDKDKRVADVGFGNVLRALALGPANDAQRRAIVEGTDGAGGYLATQYTDAQLLDLLRPAALLLQSGALVAPLLGETHSWLRIASEPTPTWRGEVNEVDEETVTFGRTMAVAKSVAFLVKASREWLQDASNAESMLQALFIRVMANEIDRVGLYGNGTTEPLGIRYASGVSEYEMGANGAVLSDYTPFLQVRRTILEANGTEPTDAIMSPRSDYALQNLVDGEGRPLQKPFAVQSMNLRVTSQALNTETQGSATDASTIFTGGFDQLILGQRLGTRIEVLRERYASTLEVGFLVHARWDTVILQAAKLGRIIGVVAS